MTDGTARFWCFTINNPKCLLDCDDIQIRMPCLSYCIYSEEVGESGTYHFQGYLELSRGQRLSYVRRFDEGGHYEIRRGTQDEAINYCRKPDETHVCGPYEWGHPSVGQGARVDIDKFKKDIESGKSVRELAEDHLSFFLRYTQGAKYLMEIFKPCKPRKPRVIWLYGPPGTGKTQSVHLRHDSVYPKPHSRWFDGWDNQDVLLLDDFCGYLPFHELLQLLDRYTFRGEIKGGFVLVNPCSIYLCSNAFPGTVYKDPKLPWQALVRRIDEWWYCGFEFWRRFETYSDFARFCGRSEFDFGVREDSGK